MKDYVKMYELITHGVTLPSCPYMGSEEEGRRLRQSMPLPDTELEYSDRTTLV